MIELGFASDFGGQSTKLSEIREGLRRISEAGFTHVHWCHEIICMHRRRCSRSSRGLTHSD